MKSELFIEYSKDFMRKCPLFEKYCPNYLRFYLEAGEYQMIHLGKKHKKTPQKYKRTPPELKEEEELFEKINSEKITK